MCHCELFGSSLHPGVLLLQVNLGSQPNRQIRILHFFLQIQNIFMFAYIKRDMKLQFTNSFKQHLTGRAADCGYIRSMAAVIWPKTNNLRYICKWIFCTSVLFTYSYSSISCYVHTIRIPLVFSSQYEQEIFYFHNTMVGTIIRHNCEQNRYSLSSSISYNGCFETFTSGKLQTINADIILVCFSSSTYVK